MPEVTYDPSSGESHFTHNGQSIETGPSHQERANLRQDIAFNNTTKHLTERAHQRDGNDVTQVGGGADLEMEQALQEAQLALHRHESGQQQVSTLEHLKLQQKVQMLAERLVGGGEEVQTTTPSRDEQQEQAKAQLLAETNEGLASDPKVQQTLQWAGETFSDETNSVFNEVTDTIQDPVKLQKSTQILKSIKDNPDSYSTADEVGTLSPQANQWFASEFSPEIAKQVTTINAALASGVTTRADAMKLVIKSPGLLEAVLSASQNPDVDFTLAL